MKLLQRNQKEELSAQSLVPIKSVDDGVILTIDNRLVLILRVSAINVELMSNNEYNFLIESYESILKSFRFEHQVEVLSHPIDLDVYIKNEKEILQETKNFYRKRLLNSYIDHCENKKSSKQVIQKQRYFICDQKMKSNTEKGYKDAFKQLEERRKHIASSFKDMNLLVGKLNNHEAIRCFHLFFDFDGAQKMEGIYYESQSINEESERSGTGISSGI